MESDPDIVITIPNNFNFQECISYLDRGHGEVLHTVTSNRLITVLRTDSGKVLCELTCFRDKLMIDILEGQPTSTELKKVRDDLIWSFDIQRDINPFYDVLNEDAKLAFMSRQYYGLRVMGIKDLFEALCWCIIGQQINLRFAHQVKRNLVTYCDDGIDHLGTRYYLFPTPEVVADINESVFREMKFSRQKTRYIKLLAARFCTGRFRDDLQGLETNEVKKRLLLETGIGQWTADYVLMRTFRDPYSVPYQDAGILNASLKLGIIDHKKDQISLRKFFDRFGKWKSYLAFYMWRTLY